MSSGSMDNPLAEEDISLTRLKIPGPALRAVPE